MIDPTPEQVEAAARAIANAGLTDTHPWETLGHPLRALYMEEAHAALVSAAGAAPQPEGLLERIADTLAYYQCRETNPKADHPRMGYHAFPEEQRAHLREQKAEAAAEIVRMMAAGFAETRSAANADTNMQSQHRRLIEELRSAPIEGHAWRSLLDRAADALAAPVQVDEAKLAESGPDENDERIKAWYRVARHPLFKSCYDSEEPLIDAMMERLNQVWEVSS